MEGRWGGKRENMGILCKVNDTSTIFKKKRIPISSHLHFPEARYQDQLNVNSDAVDQYLLIIL